MELKYVKKLIRLVRRTKLKNSFYYKDFLKEKETKIIYLAETDHSNLGDHAILYAQHKLIDDQTNQRKYCFARKDCLAGLDLIQKGIHDNDLILIPGGGWIGSLWKKSGELFLTFLELFKNNKIIVLPQTIYFEHTEYGISQAERFYQAVNHCHDITLYVRDTLSYQYLLTEMPKQTVHIKYALIPDMVLSLTPQIYPSLKNHALFVLRTDREKISDDKLLDSIKSCLLHHGLSIKYSSTHASHSISPKHREIALTTKWQEFAQARIVVTDRLHGMLFAIINHTPCIALDNLTNKVSGVYHEWLNNVPNVFLISKVSTHSEELNQIVNKLLNSNQRKFDNTIYKPYFLDIINTINKIEDKIEN